MSSEHNLKLKPSNEGRYMAYSMLVVVLLVVQLIIDVKVSNMIAMIACLMPLYLSLSRNITS